MDVVHKESGKMNGVQSVWQGGKVVFLTLVGWLAVYGTVLAQRQLPQQTKAPEPQGGSYVAAYMVVILAIALGLLVVCRSCYRRDRAKPEQYDEKKLGKEED
jgi:hypothetical protein